MYHRARSGSLALVLVGQLAASEPVGCIHVDPTLPALAAAAVSLGLAPTAGSLDAPGRLTVYQAGGGPALDRAAVERFGGHLARGNALLVTITAKPGKAAFALAPLMPTTAWQSLLPEAWRGGAEGPVEAAGGDTAFFAGAVPAVALPWYWRLRPFHAVERGESRYEVMTRKQSYLGWELAPGEPFLSRQLLNRAWTVRLAADDGRASGLLLTGSYGAGRVAVFAADAESMPAAVWTACLRWLAGVEPGEPAADPGIAVEATVDAAGRALVVTARNPGPTALRLPLLARLKTVDHALLGDVEGAIDLPASGVGTARLALPADGALALRDQDLLHARVGVLGPDARSVWWQEALVADLRPALRLSVATDELRAVPRTFTAPGPHRLRLLDRAGAQVAAYARRPGEAAQARVRVANGAVNLAPLAAVAALPGTGDTGLTALTDGMSSRAGPRDSYRWWGRWSGTAGADQAIAFRFTEPVTVARVTLWCDTRTEKDGSPVPALVVIELDGVEVARADDLDARLAAGFDQAELVLAEPRAGRELVLRLPWTGAAGRGAPRLAEVEIIGCAGDVPPARTLEVRLAMASATQRVELGTLPVTVRGGDRADAVLPFTIPDGTLTAWRLLAEVDGAPPAATPLLALNPQRTLRPIDELESPGRTFESGTIVTRGLRTYLPFGTGSRDTTGNWGEPEDLAFAYARNLKQTGAGARTHSGKLYLSEHDFRHYVNPWTSWPNGELFFAVAAPAFVARHRANQRFADAEVVQIFHSDRWDTGPSVANLYTWQEVVEFDRWLGENGLPRLTGRTRQEVVAEIRQAHEPRLRAWQLQRYLASVRLLKQAVEGEGKRLVLKGQGIPLVPLAALDELAATYRGMSDDNTWGARLEDYAVTAGIQLAIMALNPSWQLNSTLCWGWDSAVLSNPHWYSPVGITETSRRHAAVRAWRGSIGLDGSYRGMSAFGFGMNGYAPFTVTPLDWQENWNAAERWSLLQPDGPIGAGLIVSTARLDDPQRTVFSGGGMGGSGEADHLAEGIAHVFGRLHHAGISVPFAANPTCAGRWRGKAPLICLDVAAWTPEERAVLDGWLQRDLPLVLFGAAPPATATDAGWAIRGKPVVVEGRRIWVPGGHAGLTMAEADRLAALMHRLDALPLVYPPGIAGHGFTIGAMRLFTVEDWAEHGGTAAVRLRDPAARIAATALSDHRPLSVRRDGADWVIEVPLQPADGEVVLVEELP